MVFYKKMNLLINISDFLLFASPQFKKSNHTGQKQIIIVHNHPTRKKNEQLHFVPRICPKSDIIYLHSIYYVFFSLSVEFKL